MKLDSITIIPDPAAGVHGTPIPKEFTPGLVSVVLPTYNRAALLPEAMQSVRNQTYRPIELLIVDDGSSDHTAEVVRQLVESWPEDPAFRVVYLRQPNRGATAARNQGLLHSHGEFIQYLDSDDALIRHKLASHVQVLQADVSLDIVWSDWWVVPSEKLTGKLDEANRLSSLPDQPLWSPINKFIPSEPWPTLTRRRWVAQHPLWNEKTSRWDDWEYALRIMAANPRLAYVSGIVCIQREHDEFRWSIFKLDPASLEKGLVAVREAGAARVNDKKTNRKLDQCVAEHYWVLFLEALRLGMQSAAWECIGGSCRFGRRWPFQVKVLFLKAALPMVGIRMIRALLRRKYLPG